MEQDLKDIWKQATQEELVSLDQEQLIRDMKEEHQILSAAIRKRDRLEIGVALVLMPFFLIGAFFLTAIISKLGALLMLAVLGFIIYRLRSARRYEPASLAESSREYLLKLKIYYTIQRDLLREVAYWYLAPLFICICLIQLGFDMKPVVLVINIAMVAFLYIWIYFMNQSAVKKKYDPFLAEIDEKLAALGE